MGDQNIEPNDNHNDGEQLKIELNPGQSIIDICLAQLIPHLEEAELEIKEVTTKQKALISNLTQEKEELSDLINESDVTQMFISIKHCVEQLSTLKKRVWNIQKRISSLTKRSTILRMAKQREALQREHIKESMLVKEQELISKQT